MWGFYLGSLTSVRCVPNSKNLIESIKSSLLTPSLDPPRPSSTSLDPPRPLLGPLPILYIRKGLLRRICGTVMRKPYLRILSILWVSLWARIPHRQWPSRRVLEYIKHSSHARTGIKCNGGTGTPNRARELNMYNIYAAWIAGRVQQSNTSL